MKHDKSILAFGTFAVLCFALLGIWRFAAADPQSDFRTIEIPIVETTGDLSTSGSAKGRIEIVQVPDTTDSAYLGQRGSIWYVPVPKGMDIIISLTSENSTILNNLRSQNNEEDFEWLECWGTIENDQCNSKIPLRYEYVIDCQEQIDTMTDKFITVKEFLLTWQNGINGLTEMPSSISARIDYVPLQ